MFATLPHTAGVEDSRVVEAIEVWIQARQRIEFALAKIAALMAPSRGPASLFFVRRFFRFFGTPSCRRANAPLIHVHDGIIRLTLLVKIPRVCIGYTSRFVRSTCPCRFLSKILTRSNAFSPTRFPCTIFLFHMRSCASSARGCDHDLQRPEEHEHVAARGEYHIRGGSVGLTRCSAGSVLRREADLGFRCCLLRFPRFSPHTPSFPAFGTAVPRPMKMAPTSVSADGECDYFSQEYLHSLAISSLLPAVFPAKTPPPTPAPPTCRLIGRKFKFVEYPPESKKLPSGKEIVKMMEEREAKRRSAATRSGIDAHLAAAGAMTRVSGGAAT